jgi:hypothetical protein
LLREAERRERLDGDVWGIATVLAELGDLDRAEGKVERAKERYEESLALRERLGIPGSTPSLVQNLGFVALATGDVKAAAERFGSAVHQFRRAGDERGIAECVVGLAGVAAVHAGAIEAAQLLGWARHALETSGGEIWPSNRGDHARIEGAVRDALDEAGWRRAHDEGAAMSLEDVLNLAAGPGAPEDAASA